MEDRAKAQLTIGLLAYFATIWIYLKWALTNYDILFTIGLIIILLVVILILSYVIILILEWTKIFDLKTNAILAFIVLSTFMITLTIYLVVKFST